MALLVRLVSALSVDIQQDEPVLTAHLACLEGQGAEAQNLYSDSGALVNQARDDGS